MENSVYQSAEWRDVKKHSGRESVEIRFEDSRLIAFEQSITLPILGKKKILFSEGTPDTTDRKLEGLLKEFKRKSNKDYFYGVISPTIVSINPKPFVSAGLKKVSNHTLLLDLRKGEQDLWGDLDRKSIRWGVNKAKKEGLTVTGLTDESELKEFYSIYSETCTRGGLSCEKYDFFKAVLKHLVHSGRAKILVAKKGKKILSGALILISKDYNILSLTGTSEEGQRLQANVLVYWEMISASKKMGKDWLDLGGYDLYAPEGQKMYNINKFKERFGGKVFEQPFYSTNIKYVLLRFALKNMGFLKRFYRKNE